MYYFVCCFFLCSLLWYDCAKEFTIDNKKYNIMARTSFSKINPRTPGFCNDKMIRNNNGFFLQEVFYHKITYFIVTWCDFYVPDQSEFQISGAIFLFVYLEVLSVVLPICYLSKEVCEFEILQLQSMSHWMRIWWIVSINK